MRRRPMGLTPRQIVCLQAIKEHHGKTGVMPSMSELQAVLGMASRGAVHRLLLQLEERGAIIRVSRRPRAIRVAEQHCPHCGGAVS
jgi:SOS-response transcriptional repressor LexA